MSPSRNRNFRRLMTVYPKSHVTLDIQIISFQFRLNAFGITEDIEFAFLQFAFRPNETQSHVMEHLLRNI